jgi:hypothetical protein
MNSDPHDMRLPGEADDTGSVGPAAIPPAWLEPPKGVWKDAVILWILFVVLFPVWMPVLVFQWVMLRLRIRPLVRGSVEQAWDRCAAVWREAGVVGNGADDHWVFDHELAVALGRRHRRRRPFFLEKIGDVDPLLAAYAFKCLLRTGTVCRDDLPVGSLQRTEPVDVQWADMIAPEPLGQYFAGGLD